MSNLTNTISQSGVSRSELTQLAASGAYSTDMVNKILENFDEMDTNHDGRVTSAEISAFSYSCNKQEKLDEENYKKQLKHRSFIVMIRHLMFQVIVF